MATVTETKPRPVSISMGELTLQADLVLPDSARALVIFAHGSGSSRFSPRNRAVARTLNEATLATLLLDLLTMDEQRVDDRTAHLRFNIPMLTERVAGAIDWAKEDDKLRTLPIGLFGSSTGAAAALNAAAERPAEVGAVVSRGGRADLSIPSLPSVQAPVLLIVGGYDIAVIEMNREAAANMRCENRLEIVQGAGHLFEEPGKLELVAELARDWFYKKLA